MVGFRVFDVGLLIVWLVWFFRLRDEGSDLPPDDDEGGGGGPEWRPRKGPGGGGLAVPIGRVAPGSRRVRDAHRGARIPRRGTARPVPSRLPARVRSPGSPARVPRRA